MFASSGIFDAYVKCLCAPEVKPDAKMELYPWGLSPVILNLLSTEGEREAFMKYFAYGSNMSLRRLQQRTPSAASIGLFSLAKHDLRFHKAGQDGSAKCDAFYTGSAGDRVYGVLFELAQQEKHLLDHAEGLGAGYEEKRVCVVNENGCAVNAAIYYATDIDTRLKPFSWYKNHVLIGAQESKLTFDYIQKIIRTESIEDPDKYRCAQQRALYE